MKKIVLLLTSILASAALFAGGIENKTNMTPGYLRNPSRNVEAKRPEAAFYNIAGTAFLKDGLYFDVGNQFIFKEYKNKFDNSYLGMTAGLSSGVLYSKDDTPVFLYPNADIVFKKNSWAAFLNFGIYAGGGKLDYSNGTTETASTFYSTIGLLFGGSIPVMHNLTVTSMTYGEQLGFAYNIKDVVSVAAAVRFLEGFQTLSIKSPAFLLMGNMGDEMGFRANAFGISGIFGVHIRPVEKLDFSAQFQSLGKMEYSLKDIKGLYTPLLAGDFRSDLPATLNLGAGCQVIDPLYISFSFSYFFNCFAYQDSALGVTDYDNSWEVGIGADFDLNEKITLSGGSAYAYQGVDNWNNNAINPMLSSLAFGGGVEIHPVEDLTITGSAMWVKFFDETYKKVINLSKKLVMFAVGATYRLPM